MTEYERITAADIAPGDRIALTRNAPLMEVVRVISVGAKSRYIQVVGARIRPRHTTKFWRAV